MERADLSRFESIDLCLCSEIVFHGFLNKARAEHLRYQNMLYHRYVRPRDQRGLHAVGYSYGMDMKIGSLVKRSTRRVEKEDVMNLDSLRNRKSAISFEESNLIL